MYSLFHYFLKFSTAYVWRRTTSTCWATTWSTARYSSTSSHTTSTIHSKRTSFALAGTVIDKASPTPAKVAVMWKKMWKVFMAHYLYKTFSPIKLSYFWGEFHDDVFILLLHGSFSKRLFTTRKSKKWCVFYL
jgi:hypothetical protein